MHVITEEATVLDLLPEDHPSRDALKARIEEQVAVYLKRRVQKASSVDDGSADRAAPLSRIKRFLIVTGSWILMLREVRPWWRSPSGQELITNTPRFKSQFQSWPT